MNAIAAKALSHARPKSSSSASPITIPFPGSRSLMSLGVVDWYKRKACSRVRSTSDALIDKRYGLWCPICGDRAASCTLYD